MKRIYFCDLDQGLKKSLHLLDYKSRKYPLRIDESGRVYFQSNRLLSYVFSKLDLDYLWDDLKKGLVSKEEIMDLYRIAGYSLDGFIEIFCEDICNQ